MYKCPENEMNILAEKYVSSILDEEKHKNLTELYKEYNKYMKKRLSGITSDIGNGDRAEIKAEMEDTFLKVVSKYKQGKVFTHLLKVSIKRKKTSLMRKEKTKKKYNVANPIVSDDEGNEIHMIDLVADAANIEDQIIEKQYRKTELQQKELAEYFIKVNDDELTTKILDMIPHYPNLNQIADALGVHNMTVRRKLDKLRKKYNECVFGDYKAYLVN